MRRRTGRALLLALGSGFTAEILLGDQWLSRVPSLGQQVSELLLFTAFYGSAAVGIREVARRTGRGWPTILLLALAFGVVEEGIVDETLFNPHYLGLDLLSYGHLPGVGMSLPWTVYVLSLHVIWSIGAPIAVSEGLFPTRPPGKQPVSPQWQAPWLGRLGVAVIVVGYVVGATAVFAFSYLNGRFLASPGQLLGAALAAVALVVLALRLPRRAPRPAGSFWLSLLIAAVVTSAYQLVQNLPHSLSPWLSSFFLLAVLGVGLILVLLVRTNPVGLGAGAVLTYCWVGLENAKLHGTFAVSEQAVLAILAIGVLVLAWRRSGRSTAASFLTPADGERPLPSEVGPH